jgi:hypothetical protein
MAEILRPRRAFILPVNDHKDVAQPLRYFRIRALKTKYSSMNGRHWARGMVH